jgi:hypothetical protein
VDASTGKEEGFRATGGGWGAVDSARVIFSTTACEMNWLREMPSSKARSTACFLTDKGKRRGKHCLCSRLAFIVRTSFRAARLTL